MPTTTSVFRLGRWRNDGGVVPCTTGTHRINASQMHPAREVAEQQRSDREVSTKMRRHVQDWTNQKLNAEAWVTAGAKIDHFGPTKELA